MSFLNLEGYFNRFNINLFSYLYLALPLAIFLLFWLKTYISIPVVFVIIYLLIFKINYKYEDKINIKAIILIFMVSLIWAWSAGIGGLFYQSPDHAYRNAVFRDLIIFDWPVIYESYSTYLVYYLGIWMLPAMLGKLLLLIGLSFDLVWTISNLFLLIWISIGLTLVFYKIYTYLNLTIIKSLIVLILIFTFFSGLDFIGNNFSFTISWLGYHIEWWSGFPFQFRSNTTSLFWAYNGAVPIWLYSILLLKDEDIKSLGFLIALTFFYAPFSVLGSLILIIFKLIKIFIHTKTINEFIKSILSFENLFGILIVIPILLFYFGSNKSAQSGFRFYFNDVYDVSITEEIIRYLQFIFLECGIYLLLLFPRNIKNPIFYASLIGLLLSPLFVLGNITEVSLPINAPLVPLFSLCILIMQEILNTKAKFIKTFLIIFLIIGSITPIIEYYRAYDEIKKYDEIILPYDTIKTFNTENALSNFVSSLNRESFFNRYLLRK